MSAWVTVSRTGLRYRGRVTRAPFRAWAAAGGRAAIQAAAAGIRFSLFGREHAARRRLWRQLAAAARDERVVEAVDCEVNGYLTRLGALAYSTGLPRVGTELRRLVVVPRVLVNGAAYAGLYDRFQSIPAVALLDGGKALREFFMLHVISEIERAVARLRPSPTRPVAAGDEWTAVGLNATFSWRMPAFQEPAWPGHYYVLELTRQPITRGLRRTVASSIQDFEQTLPSLSLVQRHDVLRRARS